MNMKSILRLIGALALTAGTTTSVVACNAAHGPTPGVGMNVEVSKQLGLTDDKGEGIQAAMLDITTKKDDVTWAIEVLKTPINASKLLTADDKAANQASFDFITSSLSVKPKEGTTFADSVFDKALLEKIVGEVTQIKPILAKSDKDYVVTGGYFNLAFMSEKKEQIGDVYAVNLKVDEKAGVVATALAAIVKEFKFADTDANTGNIVFIKDGKIPNTAKKGALINIIGATDAVKQFEALNKVIDLQITAQMESTDAEGTWAEGNKLVISYKTSDVSFDPATVETTFTMA